MEAGCIYTWTLLFIFNVCQIHGALRPGHANSRNEGKFPIAHRIGFKHIPRTVMTEDGKLCKFPFRAGGHLHFSCRSGLISKRKWCATTRNFDRDQKWGYCVTDSSLQTVLQNHCAMNPCQNGGTCINAPFRNTYNCWCPEEFSGDDCEVAKCFDQAHYQYYDVGDTWTRIHQGKVEQCTCQDSQIQCHTGERYKACKMNPCLHGGACRLMVATGQTVCGCRDRYVGKYCNIDVRQKCYDYDNATEYRGVEKKSQSNQTCLRWNSDVLFNEVHTNTITDYILKGLGFHPFCRSLDNDDSPWCYVMKYNHVSWEHCHIPHCRDKGRRIVQEDELFAATKPKCGKKHEKRVVARGRILGGQAALPGSHPWLAAIYIKDDFCSGSLILPCWVVTAAHCFAHSPKKSSVRVVLGQQYFNESTDVTQTFEIDRYIFHDQYSVFKRNEHDIVLIKLKRKNNLCAKKTQFVQTICLPEDGISFKDGYMCQVSGWGRMNEDATEYSHVLQETMVPIVPDSKCSSPEVYGYELSDNMFCAGYFDGSTDACQGDSGGPLACEQDKISYLYGIVSWGDGCGKLNKPGVYTKVSNYVQWINSKTMPKKNDKKR
ncbi:hepatocyte growth factor activator serine protease isoform X2 [Mixophyes fleayi]|uniref:hepatocyte growth factor activator serine protease isoform X2 n=1 Tax=Mixophyes fleayi TaxID=3061075 RepID=UPI003F4D7A17